MTTRKPTSGELCFLYWPDPHDSPIAVGGPQGAPVAEAARAAREALARAADGARQVAELSAPSVASAVNQAADAAESGKVKAAYQAAAQARRAAHGIDYGAADNPEDYQAALAAIDRNHRAHQAAQEVADAAARLPDAEQGSGEAARVYYVQQEAEQLAVADIQEAMFNARAARTWRDMIEHVKAAREAFEALCPDGPIEFQFGPNTPAAKLDAVHPTLLDLEATLTSCAEDAPAPPSSQRGRRRIHPAIQQAILRLEEAGLSPDESQQVIGVSRAHLEDELRRVGLRKTSEPPDDWRRSIRRIRAAGK